MLNGAFCKRTSLYSNVNNSTKSGQNLGLLCKGECWAIFWKNIAQIIGLLLVVKYCAPDTKKSRPIGQISPILVTDCVPRHQNRYMGRYVHMGWLDLLISPLIQTDSGNFHFHGIRGSGVECN
jgi:hypothetical protein